MAREIAGIKELARHAMRGTVPTDFSASGVEVEEALREELHDLAKDYNTYRRHKFDIFEIIQEALDEEIPKRIKDVMGMFAEIRTFKNGQKPQFKVKKGRGRAKKFVTRAAESGVYRAFRLDRDVIDVDTYTLANAGYIDFARYISGDEDLAEVAALVIESIEDAIYEDVQKALRATINATTRPAVNKYADSTFNADNFAKLCAVVRSYGNGAVIFAPPEFVAAMGPMEGSEADIEDIRTKGYIGMFRGCPIVQLPNGFTDETNTETIIDPQMAYVFPSGGEKVVKIAFEGDTIVKDWENRDNSLEIQAYKNVGLAITGLYNWGVYRNTGITQTYNGPAL